MPRQCLLYVVNDAAFFFSHRLNIAKAARAQGWNVCVAVPFDSECGRIVAEGFVHHPITLSRRGIHPLEELRSLLRLCWLMRRVRPDVVHAVAIKPVIYCGVLAPFMRVPGLVQAVSGLGYVFTSRGLLASLRRTLVKVAYRIAFRHRNSRIIFQNPDDRTELSFALRGEQAALIPGAGVDARVFIPSEEPEGTPLVIFASRLLWAKGVADFVEAARLLKERGVIARFALVGKPDANSSASVPEEMLNEWVTKGIVERWGQRSDMPDVFRQSSIMCLPTFYGEGIPKVLIEAAACGRPIVTTDWPGCREIVHHEENGFLIPPKDPATLASALERLIGDVSLRRRMGEQGRQMVLERFTEEQVVDATLALYEELSGPRTQEIYSAPGNDNTKQGI